MESRRTGVGVAMVGVVLVAIACVLPRFGLLSSHLDTTIFQLYGERVWSGEIPYRDFSLEYPPGVLAAVVPPAVGSSARYAVQFQLLEALFAAVTVVLVALVLRTLGRPPWRLLGLVAATALAPLLLGHIALERFDFLPTMLCAGALLGLLRDRVGTGFSLLAAGTATKVFPIVLVPLAFIEVARRSGFGAARRGLAWFAGVLALMVGPFLVVAPGGVRFSIERQLGRSLQIESTGSSVLLALRGPLGLDLHSTFGSGSWNLVGSLPTVVAVAQSVLQAAALVGIYVWFWRAGSSPATFVQASAAAVAAFVLLNRVLSAQFVLWLLPLVPLIAGGVGLVAEVSLAVAFALTNVLYPGLEDELVGLDQGAAWVLLARNAALVAILVLAWRQVGRASRRTRAESATAAT